MLEEWLTEVERSENGRKTNYKTGLKELKTGFKQAETYKTVETGSVSKT